MQKKQIQDINTNLPEKLLGKNLPFNIDAERSVLGSLLLYDGQFGVVEDLLSNSDFYIPAHRIIYEAILEISKTNRRIDLITLQDELEKIDQLSLIGGLNYLLSLQEDIPSLGLIEQHAKIIKEKAVLRQLIGSAAQIITNCYAQNDKEIDSVLDEAERTIFNISSKRADQSFMQLNICLKRTFEHLSNIKSNSRGVTGVSSGFRTMDEMTSGFQKGDLIVLAARPSMGKTALALGFARIAALNNLSIGFFSLEMSAEQLTLRLLSAESGVPHHSIRNATIGMDEWTSLTHVASRLANTKMFIDDAAMQSIMDLRAKARKLKAEHGLDILVVDYLQLMRGHRKFENRQQEVSEISRSLKALAKELNVPIIALSQLSRAVDSRVDKRPILSDLRESGAIEQDADLIMFLYRDIVYNPNTDEPAKAEIIIGKQRNGATGSVFLDYNHELMLFYED